MDQMNNDAIAESAEEYLEHHGIMGMKWGRWNAETRARYLGVGRKLGSAVSKKVSQVGDSASRGAALAAKHASKVATSAKNAVKVKAANAAEAKKLKREKKVEVEEQRKELGMSKAKYDKLREQTLKSHDPRVVEKGMRTLTDEELNTKIKRLQTEETISKMANAQEMRRHDEHKARNQALAANPLVKLAKGALEKKLDVKGKDDKKGDKKGDDGNNDDGGSTTEPNNTGKGKSEKESKEGKSGYKNSTANASTPSTQKAASYTYPPDGIKFPKQLTGTVAKMASEKVSSSKVKEAAERGKAYVDKDVIDVTPINASSYRSKS